MTRPLTTIAREIIEDYASKGKPVHPYAAPYVSVMLTLDSIEDTYYADTARSVVLYALTNLGSWRGETAKRIKAELRAL